MTSILIIKDLSLDKDLGGKAMSAVRGGISDQANSVGQANTMAMFAPVSVGNGSLFAGGPSNIQVSSNPTQTASNTNTSTNSSALAVFGLFPGLAGIAG